MTPSSDPYRTLGLDAGATPAEIKRAYRRLAKAYHPDSAGERALPRFLAIQAAYERLTDGPSAVTGRGPRKAADRPAAQGPAAQGSPAEGSTAPPPGRSWRAEAERARATREAHRRRTNRSTGRSPGSGSDSGGGPTGPGAGAGARPGSRASGSPGSAGPPGSAGSTDKPGRGSGRRAKPKATIGSTSYDGTENEPFEPGWSGATWYGAASGTYWTINPKEYADPRKHGPEYLARANRKLSGAGEGPAQPPEGAPEPPTDPPPDRPGQPPTDPPPAARPANREAGPTVGGAAGSSGAGADSALPGRPAAAPPPAAAPLPAHDIPTESVAGPPARRALDLDLVSPDRMTGSWRGRILLAVLAWFPIGLAIFGIHGQLTGCAQFLAQCTEPVAWSVWIPQALVFGLLLLSPRLSWIGGAASLGLLIVAVPLAGLLTSISGGRPPSNNAAEVLVGAMSVGWLAGVVLSLSGRIPLPPWRSRTMRQ